MAADLNGDAGPSEERPRVDPMLEDLDREVPVSPRFRVCDCMVCGRLGRLLGRDEPGGEGPVPGLSSSLNDRPPASFLGGHAGDGVDAAVEGVGASFLAEFPPYEVICPT